MISQIFISTLTSWIFIGAFGTTQANTCNSYLLTLVKDKYLTASSHYALTYGPTHARLGSNTAWCPNETDTRPWIQIDFRQSMTVVAIVSKGTNDALFQEWVKSYQVKYLSGQTWVYVNHGSNNEFTANSDTQTLVKNDLPSPTTCQKLRLYPKDCHMFCSIRFDVVGCQATTTTSTITSQPPPSTTTTTIAMTTSPSTTTVHYDSSFCSCSCSVNSSSPLTTSDLNVKISNMVQNLTISKRKTSIFIRSKNCAQDGRPEVVYVGYLGIALLVFVTSLIVLPDLLTFSSFMYTVWNT
uniref:Lactadherin-like isoform X2 n=1 Tax=Crassostrea virginica TaxID=6565 RepID=A0A8B8DQH6_CRAVI|nr:lactadherin-like isoform X2 [Crassostrea virginica]